MPVILDKEGKMLLGLEIQHLKPKEELIV